MCIVCVLKGERKALATNKKQRTFRHRKDSLRCAKLVRACKKDFTYTYVFERGHRVEDDAAQVELDRLVDEAAAQQAVVVVNVAALER
jgi:hypothetical protein